MPEPGIATLWKPVVNVTDLDEGERFWCAVTGLSRKGRHGSSMEFSVLDAEEKADRAMWLLLQRVPEGQEMRGGTHLDLRVEDVAAAARRIEEIGGSVVTPPAFYPDDREPLLEWAVMRDPFGNDFCIIRWPLRRWAPAEPGDTDTGRAPRRNSCAAETRRDRTWRGSP